MQQQNNSINFKTTTIMKKAFLLLCLLATTTIVSATDLWEGNHEVKWDNTLSIEAAKFADAQVGQKIVIEFKDATNTVSMPTSTRWRYSSPRECWHA